MTNIERALAMPYGGNLVARCDNCGMPIFKCKCDKEEEDDEWDEVDAAYNLNRYAEEEKNEG
jgi:hypothetical protein